MKDPIKLLVVDDTEENIVALEALLRREDLQVLAARSGVEALELLLTHDFALALLDVQMPGMDGFELAELMRGSERTKHVPIIFVTAGARDPHRVFKGYETGAVDFLFKPVDPHVLKSKAEVFFALHRQRKELAEALRLQELFVGILGHDLRNPLGAILMGTRLLESPLPDDRRLRTLQRMNASGQRMSKMIEQLLDLTRARLASGVGFMRARERLDVAALVQRAVDELRVAQPRGQVVVESSGDCTILGDEARLLQLFSNLLSNAIHHGTPDTPASVAIEATEREVVVRVRNEGAIPPALLPMIFDPFRARSDSATNSDGLGLGLFISQQIAKAHDGVVSVTSTAEAGTTFTVRLARSPER